MRLFLRGNPIKITDENTYPHTYISESLWYEVLELDYYADTLSLKLVALAATYTDSIDRDKFLDGINRSFYNILSIKMPYGEFIDDQGLTPEQSKLIDDYKKYLKSIGKYKDANGNSRGAGAD